MKIVDNPVNRRRVLIEQFGWDEGNRMADMAERDGRRRDVAASLQGLIGQRFGWAETWREEGGEFTGRLKRVDTSIGFAWLAYDGTPPRGVRTVAVPADELAPIESSAAHRNAYERLARRQDAGLPPLDVTY